MLPVINIGPLVIQTGGLILLLGVWLGLTASEKAAPRFGVDPNRLYNLALIALVAGVFGARLAFAARHPQAFSGNLLAVLSPTPTMLDLGGGVLAGLIAGFIYGQRQRLHLWSTLDALSPAFAIFTLAFGVMQWATGSGFGSPTNLPWGVEMWGAVRHPAQVYTFLAAALTLAFVWRMVRRGQPAGPGSVFLSFLAMTAAAQLILETFRGDSHTIAGSLRTVQLAAWAALALALWGIGRRLRPGATPPPNAKE